MLQEAASWPKFPAVSQSNSVFSGIDNFLCALNEAAELFLRDGMMRPRLWVFEIDGFVVDRQAFEPDNPVKFRALLPELILLKLHKGFTLAAEKKESNDS